MWSLILAWLRPLWGWIAVGAAALAAIWGVRADARRDQRKETETANAQRDLEAVKDAQEMVNRYRTGGSADRDRVRERWFRD